MKYIHSVYLWIVAFVYFSFFLLFALVVSYLIKPQTYDPWLKKILRTFFKILGIPVEVRGAEKIKPRKTYLYMSNHVSMFDIPLLGGFIPGLVRGVEAGRQHRWPLYGWVMGRLGNIPIEREDIHQSINSFRKTKRIIEEGISVIILPEGHRTLDGHLKPFKKLPFHLAKTIDEELVPVGLSGLFTLKRKGSWLIRPTAIKLCIGDVITRETIDILSTSQLRDHIREKIQALVEKP